MKHEFKESLKNLIRQHPDELRHIIMLEELQAQSIEVMPESEKLIRFWVECFYSENKDRAAMGCEGLIIAIKLWGMQEDGAAALDRLLRAGTDSNFWNIIGNYKMYIPVRARQLFEVSGKIKDMMRLLK